MQYTLFDEESLGAEVLIHLLFYCYITMATNSLSWSEEGKLMIDLTGKTAIVTGAASGIGKGICLVLAAQGADVVVTDVDEKGALAVSEQVIALGQQSIAVETDVTDRASINAGVASMLQQFGKVDILVNNAGVVGASGWWERSIPSDEDWSTVWSINVLGIVHMSQAVEPHMKNRGYGKIINIASIAARQGNPSIPHYSTSKASVVSWTQANALQLAPYNINVNAVCPGLLWTPLFEHLVDRPGYFQDRDALSGLSGRARFEKLVEMIIPMKKEQTPEDIGKMVAFLSSDDAHNITGQAINVDGGRFMN